MKVQAFRAQQNHEWKISEGKLDDGGGATERNWEIPSSPLASFEMQENEMTQISSTTLMACRGQNTHERKEDDRNRYEGKPHDSWEATEEPWDILSSPIAS